MLIYLNKFLNLLKIELQGGSSYMSVNDQILDAIELLARNSVERAGYDKTIQAQIISCQDKQLGKYKCKYQDALFYAYTSSPDISLSNGTMVYILVPQNDMSKDKTIIGTVDKLGVDFVTITEGEDAYEKVGTNSLITNRLLYLNTNNINYNYDLGSEDIVLDSTSLVNYVNKSSSLIIAATIQTKSPLNRLPQSGSQYGIKFTAAFSDSTTKDFILNVDNMVGQPFQLISPTRQVAIFPIDGEHFTGIDAISIYNKNFEDAAGTQTGRLSDGDIIISNLEIYGANRLSQQQLNGVMISLYTPDGSFFADGDAETTKKRIIAQVKVKGQVVPSEGVSFYWGLEDMNVTSYNENFNQYLGYGWKYIQSGTGQVGWNPNSNYIIIEKQNIRSTKNRYKVAAIYDGNLVTRQIQIENESGVEIEIASDSGTEFFNNMGSPNLECSPHGGTYTHRWGWSNNGGYIQQAADVIGNVVDGYKLQQVQVFKIINYADFKCTVYDNSGYLGTATLTLTNEENETMNYLTLVNADAVFKYSAEGAAPNVDSLQHPQLINALTFILRDSNGIVIYDGTTHNDNSVLNTIFTEPNCVVWRIPKNNTLLKNENNGDPINNSSPYYDQEYDSYINTRTVSYNIAQSYNYNKTNNQIKLQIHYNDTVVYGQTQFVFIKQGDIGTNGTEYTVRLALNTGMSAPPQYPMITKIDGGNYVINYGIGSSTNSFQSMSSVSGVKMFKPELWRSGECVWRDGSSLDGVTSPTIEWSVLVNKYSSSYSDDTDFTIDSFTGNISYIDSLGSYSSAARACIIKCALTYEGKTYYGTMPIITAWVSNSSYSINLQQNTGFRYVIYTADGTLPQYDSTNPFTIDVTAPSGGLYTFTVIGGIKNASTGVFITNSPSHLTELTTNPTLPDNQKKYKPIGIYDGECINNSIVCTYGSYAKIRIPIHFLLNRFGQTNINAWDGNSVQIDDTGGYILAPQMGAGVKDEHNEFTGVLMGKVREAGKTSTQIGLFGYSGGARSFFLDSNTGSATFGRAGTGQIVIDATSATITGGNYNTTLGTGMQINLGASPSIQYGNKNFIVDNLGAIKLGHYNITGSSTDYWNFSVDLSGNVQMVGNLKAGKISETNNYNFEVNNSATGDNPLIKAGYDSSSSSYNFIVEADGDVSLKGTITAKSGYIGNGGSNSWIIGGDNTKGWIHTTSKNSLNSANQGIYIGTDGISIRDSSKQTFKVDSSGNVTVNGNITLGSGSQLTWGMDILDEDGRVTSSVGQLYNIAYNNILPDYIQSTYIDGARVETPEIYGGKFYATGLGEQDQAAYYIYDGYTQSFDPDDGYPTGTLGKKIGYISYDSHGTSPDATHRVMFTTLKQIFSGSSAMPTALKIQASGNLSIEAGWDSTDQVHLQKIYCMSGVQFSDIIKLQRLYSVGSSGVYHFVGGFGDTLPPTQHNSLDGYTEAYGPEIGQLFFLLD